MSETMESEKPDTGNFINGQPAGEQVSAPEGGDVVHLSDKAEDLDGGEKVANLEATEERPVIESPDTSESEESLRAQLKQINEEYGAAKKAGDVAEQGRLIGESEGVQKKLRAIKLKKLGQPIAGEKKPEAQKPAETAGEAEKKFIEQKQETLASVENMYREWPSSFRNDADAHDYALQIIKERGYFTAEGKTANLARKYQRDTADEAIERVRQLKK